MSWKVPLFEIDWDESDVEYVSDVIRGGRYWTEGLFNTFFENSIENYTATNHRKWSTETPIFKWGGSASFHL
jgi:hypothetical protein